MDYKKLLAHVGHNIVCVGYAMDFEPKEYDNVAIECEDCNEVIISFDKK